MLLLCSILYKITSKQVPSFNELEQADRYARTPNELNHKIKDFIAKNIIPKFVPQFCKHQDSRQHLTLKS